jgi:hypothetical protein
MVDIESSLPDYDEIERQVEQRNQEAILKNAEEKNNTINLNSKPPESDNDLVSTFLNPAEMEELITAQGEPGKKNSHEWDNVSVVPKKNNFTEMWDFRDNDPNEQWIRSMYDEEDFTEPTNQKVHRPDKLEDLITNLDDKMDDINSNVDIISDNLEIIREEMDNRFLKQTQNITISYKYLHRKMDILDKKLDLIINHLNISVINEDENK